MKNIFLILVGCFLISCNPQKRLQRMVKKHPELIKVDTLHFVDTITLMTQRVHQDTVTNLQSITHDTLIITKENLTVKTIYNYETDSIYIYGECDSDTITQIIERQIPYNKIEVKKSFDFKAALIISFISILITFLVLWFTDKI